MQKSAEAFRTISEVAEDLSLPQHVLRFWETRFPQIKPLKRAGGRRYYRPADVVLLKTIRHLLYDDGYTIKGVQRLIKEQGVRGLGAAPAGDLSGLAALEPADGDLERDDEPGATIHEGGNGQMALPNTVQEAVAAAAPPRAGLVEALADVDECLRILEALRQP